MMVKICGITNLEDARAAIDGGAAALGFNFWPNSPRYLAPEAARTIIEALPATVWKVGVFVNETPLHVAAVAREARLDVVQLHGQESPADVPPGFRVWKAIAVDSAAGLPSFPAEAFLLDAPSTGHGGSGNTFDWTLARRFTQKIVLAGGLDASNVRAAIEQVGPWGVDACSRIESAPGRKDHKKMLDFLKAALAA